MLGGGFVKGFRRVILDESDPDHTDKNRFIQCILVVPLENDRGAEQGEVIVYSFGRFL